MSDLGASAGASQARPTALLPNHPYHPTTPHPTTLPPHCPIVLPPYHPRWCRWYCSSSVTPRPRPVSSRERDEAHAWRAACFGRTLSLSHTHTHAHTICTLALSRGTAADASACAAPTIHPPHAPPTQPTHTKDAGLSETERLCWRRDATGGPPAAPLLQLVACGVCVSLKAYCVERRGPRHHALRSCPFYSFDE